MREWLVFREGLLYYIKFNLILKQYYCIKRYLEGTEDPFTKLIPTYAWQ